MLLFISSSIPNSTNIVHHFLFFQSLSLSSHPAPIILLHPSLFDLLASHCRPQLSPPPPPVSLAAASPPPPGSPPRPIRRACPAGRCARPRTSSRAIGVRRRAPTSPPHRRRGEWVRQSGPAPDASAPSLPAYPAPLLLLLRAAAASARPSSPARRYRASPPPPLLPAPPLGPPPTLRATSPSLCFSPPPRIPLSARATSPGLAAHHTRSRRVAAPGGTHLLLGSSASGTTDGWARRRRSPGARR